MLSLVSTRPEGGSPAPISLPGGRVTVLLVHGFTGSPAEMVLLAKVLNRAGFSVEVPLLLGHGTQLEDLVPIRPDQWVSQLDAVILREQARGQEIVVGGLSLGSVLALNAALRCPQIKALMLFSPPIGSRDWRRFAAPLLKLLVRSVRKPPSNYVDPGTASRLWSYDRYPVVCSSLVLKFIARVRRDLPRISQPLLVIASSRDNVVTARGVRLLVKRVASSTCDFLWLHNSSHALTADQEWPEVCERSVAFLRSLGLG